MLSLLQARRDWSGQLLAERLEVSSRTVRRDVERLRELGYEIKAYKGPDGGYRLVPGSELPPLRFDDDQAVAIAVALQSAAGSGVDIEEAADRALATVRQVMPSRLRHRVDGIRFSVPRAASPLDPTVLESVSAAVREHRVLRFDYRESVPRQTEPHALVARHGLWYLIGWDLVRDDWRIYRVDRMTPRVPGARCSPRGRCLLKTHPPSSRPDSRDPAVRTGGRVSARSSSNDLSASWRTGSAMGRLRSLRRPHVVSPSVPGPGREWSR